MHLDARVKTSETQQLQLKEQVNHLFVSNNHSQTLDLDMVI